MENKISNLLVEYFRYFINGLNVLINEYLIIIGIILFLLGIKDYLKMLEKEPIDYKTAPAKRETISEIRDRSVQWEWIIFAIILGICLIIENIE